MGDILERVNRVISKRVERKSIHRQICENLDRMNNPSKEQTNETSTAPIGQADNTHGEASGNGLRRIARTGEKVIEGLQLLTSSKEKIHTIDNIRDSKEESLKALLANIKDLNRVYQQINTLLADVEDLNHVYQQIHEPLKWCVLDKEESKPISDESLEKASIEYLKSYCTHIYEIKAKIDILIKPEGNFPIKREENISDYVKQILGNFEAQMNQVSRNKKAIEKVDKAYQPVKTNILQALTWSDKPTSLEQIQQSLKNLLDDIPNLAKRKLENACIKNFYQDLISDLNKLENIPNKNFDIKSLKGYNYLLEKLKLNNNGKKISEGPIEENYNHIFKEFETLTAHSDVPYYIRVFKEFETLTAHNDIPYYLYALDNIRYLMKCMEDIININANENMLDKVKRTTYNNKSKAVNFGIFDEISNNINTIKKCKEYLKNKQVHSAELSIPSEQIQEITTIEKKVCDLIDEYAKRLNSWTEIGKSYANRHRTEVGKSYANRHRTESTQIDVPEIYKELSQQLEKLQKPISEAQKLLHKFLSSNEDLKVIPKLTCYAYDLISIDKAWHRENRIDYRQLTPEVAIEKAKQERDAIVASLEEEKYQETVAKLTKYRQICEQNFDTALQGVQECPSDDQKAKTGQWQKLTALDKSVREWQAFQGKVEFYAIFGNAAGLLEAFRSRSERPDEPMRGIWEKEVVSHRRDMTWEQCNSEVKENNQKLLQGKQAVIRLSPHDMKKVIRTGIYKPAPDVFVSNNHYARIYPKICKEGKEKNDNQRDKQKKIFGFSMKLHPPECYAVYGSLTEENEYGRRAAEKYGDGYILVDWDFALRWASHTWGNSSQVGQGRPEALEGGEAMYCHDSTKKFPHSIKDIDEIDPYVELQFHAGVPIDFIKEFGLVNPKGGISKKLKEQLDKCEEQFSIPWHIREIE